MLKLTLLPDEYLTINGDIVVQLKRVAGGRADVAVDAPREMPVVRGTLEEKGSGKEAGVLRKQLDRIIPAFWEDDLAAR